MVRLCLVATFALAACARGSGAPGDAPTDTPRPADAAIDAIECAMQPCSILPQCGCDGVRACDVDTSDGMGTACRSILEPGHEDTSCSTLDRCDQGYVCLGGASSGSCKKYCATDTDCGTPRGRCAIDISSGGQPVSGIPSACSSNCNPLATGQAPECPTGYKCGLFTSTHAGTNVKIADCTPAGAGTQNSPCGTTTGNEAMCASGYLCTSVGNGFQCRRICNKATGAGCTGSQTCLGFTTPHTIDIEYGVCN